MSHPHPLSVIAQRAGLSRVTADRVLNHRGGVRVSTAAAVAPAIADLNGEHQPPGLKGQTIRVDVVAQTPGPWPSETADVLNHAVPQDVRVRFDCHQPATVIELVAVLDGIRRVKDPYRHPVQPPTRARPPQRELSRVPIPPRSNEGVTA